MAGRGGLPPRPAAWAAAVAAAAAAAALLGGCGGTPSNEQPPAGLQRGRPREASGPAGPGQRSAGNESMLLKERRSAPMQLNESEVIEQEDADIPAGGDVRLFVVGASNVLWMTWVDQLHMYLTMLGYKVPTIAAKRPAQLFPTSVQSCDDHHRFSHLRTARVGRIGWNSWDFAFDDWSGCDSQGFRNISGHSVMCEHGEGCRAGRTPFIRLSDLAEDASKSNVTVLSTWINDNKQFQTGYRCFHGEKLLREEVAQVSVPVLKRMVRAIHEKNPNVWVLIMGKYPPTSGGVVIEQTLPWLRRLNARIKEAMEQEPRTLFVDYEMPVHWEMYQTKAHYGHPNCRGSKLMAQAVVRRLWTGKALARGFRPPPAVPGAAHPASADPRCGQLEGPACHASSLCWQNEGECKAYSPGSLHYYKHPGLPTWVPGQGLHS